jgi:hypothetical protein
MSKSKKRESESSAQISQQSTKKKRETRSWTDDETSAILDYLKETITKGWGIEVNNDFLITNYEPTTK